MHKIRGGLKVSISYIYKVALGKQPIVLFLSSTWTAVLNIVWLIEGRKHGRTVHIRGTGLLRSILLMLQSMMATVWVVTTEGKSSSTVVTDVSLTMEMI